MVIDFNDNLSDVICILIAAIRTLVAMIAGREEIVWASYPTFPRLVL